MLGRDSLFFQFQKRTYNWRGPNTQQWESVELSEGESLKGACPLYNKKKKKDRPQQGTAGLIEKSSSSGKERNQRKDEGMENP